MAMLAGNSVFICELSSGAGDEAAAAGAPAEIYSGFVRAFPPPAEGNSAIPAFRADEAFPYGALLERREMDMLCRLLCERPGLREELKADDFSFFAADAVFSISARSFFQLELGPAGGKMALREEALARRLRWQLKPGSLFCWQPAEPLPVTSSFTPPLYMSGGSLGSYLRSPRLRSELVYTPREGFAAPSVYVYEGEALVPVYYLKRRSYVAPGSPFGATLNDLLEAQNRSCGE